MIPKRFKLMNPKPRFTEEMKQKIEKFFENGKFLEYLDKLGLEYAKLRIVSDNYFDFEVKETSNRWHNSFSKRIKSELGLDDSYFHIHGKRRRLFEPSHIED